MDPSEILGLMEAMDKKAAGRDRQNLIATIILPVCMGIILTGVAWMFNAKMTIERNAMEKSMTDNYVQKTWFEKYHTDTMTAIDGLRSDVSSVKSDIAVLKSQEQNNVKTTR
jgi:hypothetical protein